MLLLFNSFTKITFIFLLFKKLNKTPFFHLFIAFCETVFVLSPLLFRLFSICSFQSCSFEQDKLTSFFLQNKHLFDPSKNFFAAFMLFDEKKYFIVFRSFFFGTHVCVCYMQQEIKKKKTEKKKLQDSHALRIACAIEGSLDHCCVSRLG